ncbi:MAG: hypothetical protein J6B19_04200 [Lachnospiraceae bacterium]|nr:hypothetical protein [Lachnospiraceae bacterium]
MDVVIGYDINEYYAQISYATQGNEPETLEFPARREGGNIETALCKRSGVNQWFCGKEAVKKGVSGEGILVEKLWKLLGEQETIVIEKQEYAVPKLCQLFLGRTLEWAIQRLEEIFGESVQIRAMVLTAEPWNDDYREFMGEVTDGLCIPKERIRVQGHEDSLFSYLVYQPQRLLGYETAVFDLTGEELVTYRVEMNHKTRPIVTTMQKQMVKELIKKKHYPSITEHDRCLAQLDEQMKAYFEAFVQGRIVTALYLIGDGFKGEWYPESLKLFCRNRKVFAGNNLYGKGACYSAAGEIWESEIARKYLFLGNDMLRYNVGISMWRGEKEEYVPLLDAGTNWYDARAEVEFLMEDTKCIDILITPIDGSGSYVESIPLPELSPRPWRSYRLSMTTYMQSDHRLHLDMKDEGFGDWYEKLPISITYDLILGEKGKR